MSKKLNEVSGLQHKGGQARAGSAVIDAFEFARTSNQQQGQIALRSLSRFCADLPEQETGSNGMVAWKVQGFVTDSDRVGVRGISLVRSFLRLHVQARPNVICQRCAQVMVFPIDSTVELELVRSEAQLDQSGDEHHDVDEELSIHDDEAMVPEKVLGSSRFDVMDYVEDELILCLPFIPRHDECPSMPKPLVAKDKDAPKRVSPFLVLEQLKQKQ